MEDRIRKWRLILGKTNDDSQQSELNEDDKRLDDAVGALYQPDSYGDLSKEDPQIQKWLGDIREFFSEDQVTIMQRDALERLNLVQLLKERELLEDLVPDINLAANIIAMKELIPEEAKSSARMLIERIAEKFSKEIGFRLIEQSRGALNRSVRTNRPNFKEINWHQTIRANLKNYEASVDNIVLKQLIGNKRQAKGFEHIYIVVDQSYSMTDSLIYAGLTACILSRLPGLTIHLILFSTKIVDLTDQLDDPVDLLFGLQLGGGTDIHKALAYTNKDMQNPKQSVLVLISDLFEGGSEEGCLAELNDMKTKGSRLLCLPSLSDKSKPSFDAKFAQRIRNQDIPVFNCTPSLLPELFNQVLGSGDLQAWSKKIKN